MMKENKKKDIELSPGFLLLAPKLSPNTFLNHRIMMRDKSELLRVAGRVRPSRSQRPLHFPPTGDWEAR